MSFLWVYRALGPSHRRALAGARARGEAEYRGAYDPILPQLTRLKAGHITLEFTTPGAGDMSVLKRLPVRLMPELSYPTISGRTEYPGAAPPSMSAARNKL